MYHTKKRRIDKQLTKTARLPTVGTLTFPMHQKASTHTSTRHQATIALGCRLAGALRGPSVEELDDIGNPTAKID